MSPAPPAPAAPPVSRGAAWLPWILLAVAAGDWLLAKNRLAGHPPWVLAVLAVAALAAFVARLAAVASALWRRRRRPGSGAAEIVLLSGVVAALAAGTANWLFSLQGFLVLHEGEAVPLHRGAHLQEFVTGPLSRLAEMDVALALREVELEPAGAGFFYPHSTLEVRRGEAQPKVLEISPAKSAAAGTLRFHQGAFGFAPRIVILRDGEQVFDRVVPFTSERRGPSGIVFAGRFTIAAESLAVDGQVDLASLDEGMRGHATLHLEVRREDALLGRGSLLPGHFADMAQGYRVGFAGLEKWSEIDVSRRHYGEVVLAGAALAIAGAALWSLAWWRGW